jgi:hypothetical protein
MENSNYNAVVVKISNLHKLDGLDRLLGTNIFGNQVLVGTETKEGDVGLYFPVESQLGEEFCQANDLYRRKDETTGKPAGGMFDQNRRVRCQKFRGHQSMGFWIPINCLEFVWPKNEIPLLEEGTELSEIEGLIISQKYIPRGNKGGLGGGPKQGRKGRSSKVVDGQFHFHFDTSHLGKNIHKINPEDVIAITWKFHGTSAIAANVLCKPKLTRWEKIKSFIFGWEYENYYDYLYASRRVIKNEFHEDKLHFYGYDLWTTVGQENFGDKLHKGETVYYEIVGFTKDGAYVQKDFDYGCDIKYLPVYKVYVYRITQTNVDGIITELQWNQVKQRCTELGVNYVPEIFYGKAKELLPNIEQHWQENFLSMLQKLYVYDQDSAFCDNKVPEEGIVVRKEGFGVECFKLKSFRFQEYETKQLDNGEVDMETEQSENAEINNN